MRRGAAGAGDVWLLRYVWRGLAVGNACKAKCIAVVRVTHVTHIQERGYAWWRAAC